MRQVTKRRMNMKRTRIYFSCKPTMTAVVISYADGDMVIDMVIDRYADCVVRQTTVIWPSQ